jgi:hypothetical protein
MAGSAGTSDLHSNFCRTRTMMREVQRETPACLQNQIKQAEWYTPATGALDARNGN